MRGHIVLALGLALALPCLGAWAQETNGTPGVAVQERTMTERGPWIAAEEIHTPLQGFVSEQVHEVGELSQQFQIFKAADRPDVVSVLYHMVRDHVLVSDAAKNILARRGDVSRPVVLFSQQPMPNTPEELIRHNIMSHEQALERTRDLLNNAGSDEERNIYQAALDATEKHLGWLRNLDQGQRVSLGFFGPTIPLSRIASYREEIGQRPTSRMNGTNSRTNGTNGRINGTNGNGIRY